MRKYYKAIKVDGKKKDEHRHIMEIHLGRKLNRNEVVHHKDGDILNNDLSNLEVMPLSDHSRLHTSGRTPADATREKLRVLGIKNRPAAKLTIEQVLVIKESIARGARVVDLARMFKVGKTTISSIKVGKSFRWL